MYLFLTMLAGAANMHDKDAVLEGRLELGPYLWFWEDASGAASFSQVQDFDSQWQRLNAPFVNLGFVHSAFWFHVTLQSPYSSAHSLLLEQHYALMDDMQVHWRCESGFTADYVAGDLRPWRERPFQHHVFVFPLEVDAHDRCELWVRAQNTEAMELPLILWEKDVFFDQQRNKLLVDGMFFGFFAIMALYNFVLFINVRDKSYLYYTLFVASMFLFFASQQGNLYEWVFNDKPLWHHYLIPINLAMDAVFGSLFFLRFLNLSRQAPRLAFSVKGVIIVLAFAPLTAFFLNYSVAIIIIIVFTATLGVLGLTGAVYLSFQHVRSAQILLAGWFMLVTCVVFQTLSKLGALHNDFIAEYGLRMGTALEVVIFSFALSYRINEERKAKEDALLSVQHERVEKLHAQEIALANEIEAREAREHALDQQRRLNEQLEFMVHERTHELEGALNELERTNRELQALSVKDALTNVFNRRFFNQKISEEWSKANRLHRSFALLMIDIDKFKIINDTQGHVCGDHVLTKVAAVLKNVACRPGDTISRYGGEEFAVLLPDTGEDGAEKVAEMLVARVAMEPIYFNNTLIPVTISIGLAATQGTANDADVQTFIERADKALYHAKDSGRNRFCTGIMQ